MKASIYQRKSDMRWVGSISDGKNNDGSRKRIPPVYGKTEKEVEEKVNVILYELQTGQYQVKNKDTLIGFLKEYHKVCAGFDIWNPDSICPEKAKWELTTSQLNKMYIDVHFEPYFKEMKLKDVNTLALDTYYNFKLADRRSYKVKKEGKLITKSREPLSINSVIKLNKFLKAAFNYAIVNDMIKKNPTVGTKLSSPEEYEPTVYNEKQFLKLLNYVHGGDEEIPIVIAAGCGFRRGEICGIRWKNIDFENRTISVEKTYVRFIKNIEKAPKTKKSKRTLSAPGYVLETLDIYYKSIGSPNKNQKVITRWKPQSLSEMFKDLLEKFKMQPIRLHDLRHYNAVIMMNHGIADKVAAERLGHSSIGTLKRTYQHVLKDIDETAAELINDSFIQQKDLNIISKNDNKILSKDEKRALFKVI